MLTNGAVTLFHLDENEGWQRCFFPACAVHHTTKISGSAKGVEYANLCTIRIPGEGDVSVSAGDYVFLGEAFEDVPQKADCLTVVGFSDNRRGQKRMRHWRVAAR